MLNVGSFLRLTFQKRTNQMRDSKEISCAKFIIAFMNINYSVQLKCTNEFKNAIVVLGKYPFVTTSKIICKRNILKLSNSQILFFKRIYMFKIQTPDFAHIRHYTHLSGS